MDALGHYRSTCENTRQVLESGSPVRQAFDDAGRGNARAVITDAMLRFERLRHASRLSLFALGAEEGVTKAEVSDALGISRQLVERWLRESGAQDGTSG